LRIYVLKTNASAKSKLKEIIKDRIKSNDFTKRCEKDIEKDKKFLENLK
jgi:hypothetical protein